METLYIVVPCYNEQEVLPETVKRLTDKLKSLKKQKLVSASSKVLFVDDGSKDGTWDLLCRYFKEHDNVSAIRLSRNYGHQKALMAGLMTAKELCDFSISMDADLQDDINAVDQMVEKFGEGCDVVYGVRSKRKTDTFFKKATAQGFYKFMKLLGVDIVYNHADYRLLSKRALQALSEYKESSLFLRGIVKLLGFKSDIVYYERTSRFAGESKFPFKKMFSFALDGISSFSVKPLKIITRIGFLIVFISMAIFIYSFISDSFFNVPITTEWAAIMVSIWFLGGVQLICLGIIGGYIGKIFDESKKRPHYHIDIFLSNDKEFTQ